MIGKKNAPYSSARRAQNQQTADVGSWARRMVGMETPTEREQSNSPRRSQPNSVDKYVTEQQKVTPGLTKENVLEGSSPTSPTKRVKKTP
jgi:hypothetical protein